MVDVEKESIVVFDKSGIFFEEIVKGCLEYVCSVVVDYNYGNIVVCDRGNRLVNIYS